MDALDLSMGTLLIGIVVNVMLYGVMLVQTFEYYLTCERDFRLIKCMVAFIFVTDTVNSGLNVSYLYYYLVSGFGNYEKVNTTKWMGNSDPAFTSVIGAVVQIFYAYRILRLTRNRWIFGFIVTSAVISTGAGLAATINLASVSELSDLQAIKKEVLTWLSIAVATDIVITSTLVLFLRSYRTGIAATDRLIDRIIRMTVQTGLITAIWATLAMTLYQTIEQEVHFIFTFSLCKIYSNTLMSSLNARSVWNNHTNESQATTITTMRFEYRERETIQQTALTSQTVDTATVDTRRIDIEHTDPNGISSSVMPVKSQFPAVSSYVHNDVNEVYVGPSQKP